MMISPPSFGELATDTNVVANQSQQFQPGGQAKPHNDDMLSHVVRCARNTLRMSSRDVRARNETKQFGLLGKREVQRSTKGMGCAQRAKMRLTTPNVLGVASTHYRTRGATRYVTPRMKTGLSR